MPHPIDQIVEVFDRPGFENLGQAQTIEAIIPFETPPQFKHYASELLDMLGFETFDEILVPLERAMLACQTMGIAEDQHFKQIYRFNTLSLSLRCDYKLSPLAAYLVTINANPTNINVARAQVY